MLFYPIGFRVDWIYPANAEQRSPDQEKYDDLGSKEKYSTEENSPYSTEIILPATHYGKKTRFQ
jgi:hypothetical protein